MASTGLISCQTRAKSDNAWLTRQTTYTHTQKPCAHKTQKENSSYHGTRLVDGGEGALLVSDRRKAIAAQVVPSAKQVAIQSMRSNKSQQGGNTREGGSTATEREPPPSPAAAAAASVVVKTSF